MNNILSQEWVAVHMCGFHGDLETQLLPRRAKLMIKGGGEKVVDWIWKLCNMAFEIGVVPED